MKIKNFINKLTILIQILPVFMACARNQRLDQPQDEVKPVQDSFEILSVEPTEDWNDAPSRDTPAPLAEPISPEIAARFPHLEPQIGQILLGNAQVQVVISGIPPVPSGNPWQPAILEMFHKRGDRWEKFGGLGPMDLKLSNGRENFTAIGLDTNITSHRASVIFFLAGKDSQGAKAKLVYHLAAHEPAMQMIFEDFISSKNQNNRPWDWRLRFRPNAGQVHLIPDRFNKEKWRRAVTHVLGDEVISIVSFGPLESDAREGEVVIGAPRGQAYKAGVEFFIGEESAGRVPFKIVTTESCYQQLLKKGEVSHSSLIDCRLKARPGFLKLALFPEENPIASFPRLIFFRDQDNRMVGAVPGVAGRDYQVFMSQQDVYRIIEVNEQGEQRRAEFTLNENQVGKLTLAPRKPANLRVELFSPTERLNAPAVMEIVNANEPRAIPVGKYAPSDATIEPLSPYFLLVKKWPVSVLLPAAKYQVSVYRGNMGKICQKEVLLPAVTRQQVDCRVDATREKSRLKSAALADYSTVLPEQSPGVLAEVLGVRMLASDPFHASEPTAKVGSLPILEIKDPMLGGTIRLLGATPAVVNAWRQHQEKAKGPIAKQAMAFAREQSILTELTCPGTGMNVEDYGRLADQLQPDILQVFGCGSVGHQERLLRQINTNLSKKTKAPLLGAASFQQSYFRNFQFAAWAFPTDKLPLTGKILTADDVLPLIKKGDYSLSAGGYVAFLPTEKPENGKPVKGPIQISVKAEALPGSAPTRVVLWGENDVVQEMKWDETAGREQTLRFTLKTRPRRKWLRVELRGRDEALAKQGSEIVLATSNFLSLP